MAKTIPILQHGLAESEALRAIDSGKLVVYPTDTLYGIGCNALDAPAVALLRAAKGRDSAKPLSVIVADYPMLAAYCKLDGKQRHILHSLLPGPYTFILPLISPMPASPGMTIGIRVPEHFFMRQVSKKLAYPIVSTSANLSGGKEASELKEVDPAILGKAEIAIDGGKCKYAQGSTVIDLIAMRVVRVGAVREGDRIEL